MTKIFPTRAALVATLCGATLVAAGAPAAAQSASDRDDARCILVLTALGRDPKQRAAAAEGVFYYLGRLDGRGIGPKLGPTMLAESKTIQNTDQLKTELARCGNHLRQRSGELQAVFENLRKLAPPANPAPTAAPK